MSLGKGIILYDYIAPQGGAERVVIALLKALRGTDLCVGYKHPGGISDAIPPNIRCYPIATPCKVPAWRSLRLSKAFLRKTSFLSRYDWVLYSGTVAPLAVRNHPHGRNLYYCHTIPRFAYDLYDYYLSSLAPWERPIFNCFAAFTRRRYAAAVSKMETIIVNSRNVSRRMETYLRLQSQIVHPPCDVDFFKWLGQDDYYLSTARLEIFKRVDLVVEAFKQMPDKKLVVTSGGQELARLKSLAGNAKNIVFTGWTSEEALRKLVGKAIATIYVPMDEDFGMSPVESMAAGKPVIGVTEGGLLETVLHQKTGLLINANPSPEDLIHAVKQMDAPTARAMRNDCEIQAARFHTRVFTEKMGRIIAGGQTNPTGRISTAMEFHHEST